MLVFGDRSETVDAAELLRKIGRSLHAIGTMPRGLNRHSALVATLIESGRLLQAVEDEGSAASAELNLFLTQLAAAALRSWDSKFATIGDLPPVPPIRLSGKLTLRVPEGFAFYAVYPEAYADAARRLKLHAAPRVIGIRSIGTTLGAMVAAALEAPPPITVRPFGDPFARQVELPETVLESEPHFVIVDEGPGLSGSSFAAVARWLEKRGVPLNRIAFVPSHSGDPGPEASEKDRERWKRAQRVVAEVDPQWLVERFGPLRRLRGRERLKFLGRDDGGRLLLKFAGLADVGERKLRMAEVLHSAGLVPQPSGLFHGFLGERWLDDAHPLESGERPVAEIGSYIAARADLFLTHDASGASLDQLAEMARRNVSLALGEDWRARVPIPRSTAAKRVRTDNRLDRDKWLRLPDGRLLKTDALDHHQSHDLIGCQNSAWDVAGAIVEFDLNASEAAELTAASGPVVDRSLIDFFLIAYASFRLGQAVLRAAGERDIARYRDGLRRRLNAPAKTTMEQQL
jgi:hypothetical protein